MAINVEIKARVHDLEKLREMTERICGAGQKIMQEDTFFHVPRGRLKLRLLSPRLGQLIFYERADKAGPKESHYFISKTTDPDSLRDLLTRSLGVRGAVRKERWLYLHGQTRVHLDLVEQLGSFLELEVVLLPGQSPEEGQAIAEAMMSRLEIHPEDLVEGAYIDLLLAGTAQT